MSNLMGYIGESYLDTGYVYFVLDEVRKPGIRIYWLYGFIPVPYFRTGKYLIRTVHVDPPEARTSEYDPREGF